jgi:hypothetical protein
VLSTYKFEEIRGKNHPKITKTIIKRVKLGYIKGKIVGTIDQKINFSRETNKPMSML